MQPQMYEGRMAAKYDGERDHHKMYSVDPSVLRELDEIALSVPIGEETPSFRTKKGYFLMPAEGVGVTVTIRRERAFGGEDGEQQDVRVEVQSPNAKLPEALEKLIDKYKLKRPGEEQQGEQTPEESATQ